MSRTFTKCKTWAYYENIDCEFRHLVLRFSTVWKVTESLCRRFMLEKSEQKLANFLQNNVFKQKNETTDILAFHQFGPLSLI